MITSLGLLWMLGCPRAGGPAVALDAIEAPAQFALRTPGRDIAGGAFVRTTADGEIWLVATTPIGTELFRVHVNGAEQEVRAAVPEMEPVLNRIPFSRDLALVYRWRCAAPPCKTALGRLTQDGDAMRWRGHGGGARVRVGAGEVVLVDDRRSYELRVIGSLPDAR